MMTVTLPDLQPLLGLVLAHVDVRGRLLQANAGFLRLLQAPPRLDADIQTVVRTDTLADAAGLAHLFIQPDFASLLRFCQDTDAAKPWAYQGLLTFGDYAGQTRTLRSWIKPTPQGLQLLAEFDVAELERVNATVLDLNRRHAQAQMEVTQAHFKLRQVADELARSNAELQSLNVQLTQVHGQLLQSEKLASVGMLAAGVAHEINNPLAFVTTNVNTLGGYVGDLLRMLDADEQALRDPLSHTEHLAQLQEDLERAHVREDVGPLIQESLSGLKRIKDIVQALRDFALVDSPQAWQAHDLLDVLDSTVQSLWPHIGQGCTLRKDYSALPPVVCVLPAMVQVFTHLLTNATQAVNGAGEVTLRSGCTGDQVWLEVADNGPGIAPEHLPHLFDPFFTTRAVGQGRGLGLAVVYGIVTRHHGHIDVNSTPGAGACFRVWLPLSQPTPTVLPSPA